VTRLAQRLELSGWVRNEPRGVVIQVEGSEQSLDRFEQGLLSEAPPAARIEALEAAASEPTGAHTFTIELSEPPSTPGVRVPRDLATCRHCVAEVLDPKNRRSGYPFTNCTDCGPRFTILDALPYDRPRTTMDRFPLCPDCAKEYSDPANRRYHAEPIACSACGPQLELWDRTGAACDRGRAALEGALAALDRGEIVAIKGLGGYQLLVRADDEHAVGRLRRAKRRPTKPLAVMVAELGDVDRLARCSEDERRELSSADNPIVLVRKREDARWPLADAVAPRLRTVGLFLPTTPLHHLILRRQRSPLVATSGNRGDEPIVTDESCLLSRLEGIADWYLVHDRPIARRADDSVVQVVGHSRQVLRLARGLAPWPLEHLERWIARRGGADPTLAAGGQQKVALALWSGEQAILAPHLGDLDTWEARVDLELQSQRLTSLYRFVPKRLACDMHPDYVTTRWAESQALPTIAVQHHHAHAVAAMVEHNLIERSVFALTWDGTGFGTDGTVWGAELLRARVDHFQRLASLWPIPLLGGERAIREPWRQAVGVITLALGPDSAHDPWLASRLGVPVTHLKRLSGLLERSGHWHTWSSAMGRLFDAVAALALGIVEVSHEGEAAAWLEAVADPETDTSYPLPIVEEEPPAGERLPRGDWRPMIRAIVADLKAERSPTVVAARFHNALAQWAVNLVERNQGAPVVLGGGCWVNRRLAESVVKALAERGHSVHLASAIPPNDGGLAVGQLAVSLAMQRRGPA
jgi:hydrogenase maturation protein HypF